MPYNVFYIAFFAIALGIAIALLTRFGKPAEKQQVLPEAAYEERGGHAFAGQVGAQDLRSLARRLFRRYGIQVESEAVNSERDFYLVGSSSDPVVGGRYVLNCYLAEDNEVL